MSDQTADAPSPYVLPDEVVAEWENVLRALDEVDGERLETRRHNAIVYAAVLCLSDEKDIRSAVRRYHTDAVFHARCQELAHLVRSLP